MAAQHGRRKRFVQFWASRGAKFPKMGESLPRTPMNHRAKFDAARFILGGAICTVQTHTKNKQQNKKTVIDPHLPY